MDELKNQLDKALAGKAAARKKRAALPYPEKVRIVVRLQERSAPIKRAQGKLVRIWQID